MLGAMALGLVSGALGTFAVLRKQSLLGDAISHAALPGIALAFIFTGSKSTLVLLLGAALSGWIATLLMLNVVRTTRIKEDSALGLVLSVFFGFGLVLLTYLQKIPNAAQAGLEKFLFGQAATILFEDVLVVAGVGIFIGLVTILFWKEFKLISFDPDFGAALGFPVNRLNILLTSLLVVAIVLGLQMVGVVLMSAMIVAPAAAARQWTNNMSVMVWLSAAFGAIAGLTGSLLSSLVPRLPTGPTIVLCISAIVVLSLFLAPARGLLWDWFRQRRNIRQFHSEAVLIDLYSLALQHKDLSHAHKAAVLETMNLNRAAVRRNLQILLQKGFVRELKNDFWSISDSGIREAQELLKRHEVE